MNVEVLLAKYHGMSYDDLANAAICLERVIERDTEIGATTCVTTNCHYLQLMDRVMREKEDGKIS